MNDDRDSGLERLFQVAAQLLVDDAFVAAVMQRIDALRRRSLLVWAVVTLVLLPVAWLLAAPLFDTARLAADILPTPLFEVDGGWLQQLLSPVNSVAAAILFGVLLLRWAYRKVFA